MDMGTSGATVNEGLGKMDGGEKSSEENSASKLKK
jgi:hypothetical protein